VVVLAVQRDAPTASLAPVLATLRDMESRHGSDLTHGLARELVRSDPSGWTPATNLMLSDQLDEMLDTAKQRWRAPSHAAAALAWKCYTYWLAMPALIGYAAARRVPLSTPASVLVRYSIHQPFLTMALHRPTVAVLRTDPLATSNAPGIVVCDDEDALRAELRRALVDNHLELLLAGIRDRVHIGRRTLMGSLASGAAHALSRASTSIWPDAGPLRAASLLATVDDVLTTLGVADLVDITPDQVTGRLSIQRRTCCLAFTLPEPKVCTGCCIR
jgi:hypothetical protein